MSFRRTYKFHLLLNGRKIREVIIDPHYEFKHQEMSDFIILRLLSQLEGRAFLEKGRKEDWAFFSIDGIKLSRKPYRLVWCLRDNHDFLGVINCFRR